MNAEQLAEQKKVLEVGTGSDCYLFARAVEGADRAKLMARKSELEDK